MNRLKHGQSIPKDAEGNKPIIPMTLADLNNYQQLSWVAKSRSNLLGLKSICIMALVKNHSKLLHQGSFHLFFVTTLRP